MTLKELKDKIEEIESSLPEEIGIEDIYIQKNFMDKYDYIDLEMHNYLGFPYILITLK